MNRSGLIMMQAVGALTILPYPFVLLANIMSIAAPGQTPAGALPFWLMSFYPIVWIALWIVSWRAMRRGQVSVAFGLSSVPVLALTGVLALYIYSWVGFGLFYENAAAAVPKKMEPGNPILWTVWKTAADHNFPPGPAATPVEAIQSILNNKSRVNEGVPGYGTPLKVAVDNLSTRTDGFGNQADMMLIVRVLRSHGAKLAPDEATVQREWRVKLCDWQEPITTSTENPLVWRILTRKRDGITPFQLKDDERRWLNIPTRLHGTPLYAALLEDAPDLFPDLIKAGARLSPDEGKNQTTSSALKSILNSDPDLKRAYSPQ